jgi:hypothetical protein
MRSPQARARSSRAEGNTVQRVRGVRGVRRALSSSCGLVGMSRLMTAVVGAARARGAERGVQRSVRIDSMPCQLTGTNARCVRRICRSVEFCGRPEVVIRVHYTDSTVRK